MLPRRAAKLIPLFLLILTLALYLRATSCGFVNLDDTSYVTENVHVLGGLQPAGVAWAFTSVEMANWHPLTWLSHMADAQFYGMDAGGHHLTSVLLHCANVLLLFFFLSRSTGAAWRSACVAALFAVHPLHVESVAWVSERKDVLSAFFFLWALIGYRAYSERPTPLRYLMVALLFALGLMAKPMLVTFPLLLILLDYWPLARFPDRATAGRLLLEKLPLLGLSAASAVVTVYAQKGGGAVVSREVIPVGARVANALFAYAAYLGKTVWPSGLAALYPFPTEFPPGKVAAAALLMVAITALALRQWRRQPYLPVGWLWFCGTLVPVIGLVQVGGQAMADRYSYIPHMGLFIALVWGVAEAWQRSRRAPAPLALASAAAIASLAAVTWLQIPYWGNGVLLFGHAVACTEKNALAHYHLGVALTERGRTEEAIRQYRQAAQIEPAFALAHFGLGCSLMQSGEPAAGIAEYEIAARLDPRDAKLLTNLGLALFQQGELDKAVRRYSEALLLSPQDDNLRNNLGVALLKLGRTAEAQAQFQAALQVNPANEWARSNIASIQRSATPQ
jgi:protein O-mannosyl-transferase